MNQIRQSQHPTVTLNSKDDLTEGRYIGKIIPLNTFDNNSTFEYLPLFRGLSLIQTYFDETPEEDDYLENSLVCLRQIGNVHTDMYGFTGYTDDRGELCLPTKALSIEFVSNAVQDWITFSLRNEVSQLYPAGRYIHYKFIDDKIITDRRNTLLSIAYRTYKQDEQGLPLITEKEANACAYWWKWVKTRRDLYKGNQLAGNLLQLATQEKNKAINQARIPEHYSQNFMDQMLNIVYSQDRKVYARGYKPVKI
jgi:hypothetical protein